MKSFNRIAVLCAAATLITASFAFAQDTTKTFVISGTIGPGLGGVEMKGFPSPVYTDENGFYAAEIFQGFTGNITPVKAGYRFKPTSVSYAKVDSDKKNQNYEAEIITLKISGSVGMNGVVMNGLPGNPVTDPSGHYSVSVPFGWAGQVRPHKDGFTFRPPAKIYSAVNEDMTNQDYVAESLSYTISGNVGVAGVVMQGLPGNTISDHRGRYSATVPYGWSGTVIPTKEGYTFEPANRAYNQVHFNQDNQNYKAEQILLDISGDINIAGVLLEGLPGMPITDENGRYSSRIPYGWGGTVTPIKEGLVMTPASRSYTAVAADQKNQDYFAEPLMLTITDVVKVNGQPVPGVKVTTNDGISSVTDTKGRYAIIVPYGWTGEIALHKEGYKFDPPSKPFANVVTNIRDGVSEQQSPFRARTSSRVRSIGAYSSSIGRTDNRRILVVPDGDVKSEELARMVEDMYVMSYILDERFKEPRMIRGVFRDFGDFFGRDNRQTEAVYMQGYGIVFMMEVDYTFTPAPQTPEQTAGEPNKEVDSTWQLAKERMFSPGTGSISRSGDGQEYEGQMVDELKADLVRTLKHASNIRNLAPNEWIVLSVTGTGSQSGVNVMGGWQVYGQSSSRMRAPSSSGRVGSYGGVRSSDGGGAAMGGYGGGGMMGGYGGAGMSGYGGSSMGGYGSSGMGGSAGGMMGGYGGGGMGGSAGGMMGGMGGYSEPNVSPSTVLTIRAMKADVDAFSEGELNFDEFRQRVQILMY